MVPIFATSKALIETSISSEQNTEADLRFWRLVFLFRLRRLRRRYCAGLNRERMIVGMSFFG